MKIASLYPVHLLSATIAILLSLTATSIASQVGTLAIGERDTINNITGAGAAHVLKRTSAGLTGTGSQHWHQDNDGKGSQSEADDRFGSSLSYGDFNGDGFVDLAIGTPNEEIDGKDSSGAFHVLYGTAAGLSNAGSDWWIKQLLQGGAEPNELFGTTLCSGDFNNDSFDDLAAAAPLEDNGADENAGIVYIFDGSDNGLVYDPMSTVQGSGENRRGRLLAGGTLL